MKLVRHYCDVCDKRLPKRSEVRPSDRERLVLDMLTHGYGMQDGHHRYRLSICSSRCGLRALKAIIASIENENEDYDNQLPVPGTEEWRAALGRRAPKQPRAAPAR